MNNRVNMTIGACPEITNCKLPSFHLVSTQRKGPKATLKTNTKFVLKPILMIKKHKKRG